MSKTALQELIEFMQNDNIRYVGQCVDKAKQLIEKEREQITDAHRSGELAKKGDATLSIRANEYYESKYGKND